MKTIIAIITVVALALFAASPALGAPAKAPPPPKKAEKPPAVQQAVFRITGLFSPDREADLRAAVEKVPGVQLISVDIERGHGTFSINPAVAFPGTKPDKFAERFDQLLRVAANHTLGVKAVSGAAPEKLTRVEIGIGGLDCKACCLGVHWILMKDDGVEQAIVNLKDGLTTVLIDPEKTSKEKLQAALKAREVPIK
jgi:copper chaperone CopZ